MNEIVPAKEENGLAVAPPPGSVSAAMVINAPLMQITEQLRTLDFVERNWSGVTYLGCERGLEAKFLDRAKELRRTRLPFAAEVRRAVETMWAIVCEEGEPINHNGAIAMLTILFSSFQKRKLDNSATIKLHMCADMFDPINDDIGMATGLWRPINKHPVILALAVKRLIATETFEPMPNELRNAIRLVAEKLHDRLRHAQAWLDDLAQAERIIFEFDRKAWANSHRSTFEIEQARAISLRFEDGDERREKARMAALDKIEKRLLLGRLQAAPARIAACEAKQAKLTHKPKRTLIQC